MKFVNFVTDSVTRTKKVEILYHFIAGVALKLLIKTTYISKHFLYIKN